MFLVTPGRPTKTMFQPSHALVHSPVTQTLFFLGIHVPLGYLISLNDWIGTLHALFILIYGFNAALQRRVDKLLFALGYIAGAEVLWRMSSANLPWETAKYGSIMIVVVALMMEKKRDRIHRKSLRGFPWLIVYLALLIPAVVIPVSDYGFFQSRNFLSFNLSGSISLAVLGIYFWNRILRKKDLSTLLLAIVGPICGVWFLSLYSTLTEEVIFSLESNYITSGGYGPNQVSNILGLGALACLMLIVILDGLPSLKFILFLIMGAFLVQALLTFSRGGVYSFFLAASILALHLARTPFFRKRFFIIMFAASILTLYGVIPRLDVFTQGLWWERLSDLESTGRVDLMYADWQAFLENPISGLGVGGSKIYHQLTLGDPRPAHTEYTRMLAEHGILGLMSLIILVGIVVNRYWKNQKGVDRAIVATLSIWGLAVMGQSAMRFVAISFCLALAFAFWHIEDKKDNIH